MISTAYRGVTAAAWYRAFQTFSKEMAADPSAMNQGTRAVLDRCLKIAKDELIRRPRTQEVSAAQRKLLPAGVDYRLKQRELVEVWCEMNSILPARTSMTCTAASTSSGIKSGRCNSSFRSRRCQTRRRAA